MSTETLYTDLDFVKTMAFHELMNDVNKGVYTVCEGMSGENDTKSDIVRKEKLLVRFLRLLCGIVRSCTKD